MPLRSLSRVELNQINLVVFTSVGTRVVGVRTDTPVGFSGGIPGVVITGVVGTVKVLYFILIEAENHTSDVVKDCCLGDHGDNAVMNLIQQQMEENIISF